MNDIKYLDPVGTQNLITETKSRLASKQNIIQVETLPNASSEALGEVYQYIGATSGSYTSGFFYKCITDGSTYSWVEVKMPADGIWKGTQAEYELVKNDIPNDTIIFVTDGNQSDPGVSSSGLTFLTEVVYVYNETIKTISISRNITDFDYLVILSFCENTTYKPLSTFDCNYTVSLPTEKLANGNQFAFDDTTNSTSHFNIQCNKSGSTILLNSLKISTTLKADYFIYTLRIYGLKI